MWVTEETPLPFTSVPFSATEANKFGEAAEAVGGASATITASAIPNKRARVVTVFIVILLQRNRDLEFLLWPLTGFCFWGSCYSLRKHKHFFSQFRRWFLVSRWKQRWQRTCHSLWQETMVNLQALCSGGLSVRIAGKDKGIVACYLQQLVFPAILISE